jgi:hypothetical protein
MNVTELNIQVDIEKMKLSEQEEFERLSGCALFDLAKKGLSGRRLAALIYIFAKRVEPKVTFEECLDLDMNQASALMADDADPKGKDN